MKAKKLKKLRNRLIWQSAQISARQIQSAFSRSPELGRAKLAETFSIIEAKTPMNLKFDQYRSIKEPSVVVGALKIERIEHTHLTEAVRISLRGGQKANMSADWAHFRLNEITRDDWYISSKDGSFSAMKNGEFKADYERIGENDTPEAKPEFKPGDVVQLKSGGPAMTVMFTNDFSRQSECLWFDVNNHIQARYIPFEILKKY